MFICVGIGCGDRSAQSRGSVSPRICEPDTAKKAEEIAATAASWEQAHTMFKDYSACDDGAVGEGFTESVTSLLANRWSDLPQLSTISESDADFKEFVLRHIDETAPEDRLVAISRLARDRCADAQRSLCALIQARLGELVPTPK